MTLSPYEVGSQIYAQNAEKVDRRYSESQLKGNMKKLEMCLFTFLAGQSVM